MVAFAVSLLVGIGGCVAIVLYGRRRPQGAPLTWGEAMAAAAFAFFLFLWWYGTIPHQWLTYADNELLWRPDRVVFGPGDILQPDAFGGWLPVTITYQTIRDIIAAGIYGLGLAVQVAMWAVWQGRGRVREAVPTSTYGRPLVRRG
jgi:hypothetical protein